MPDDRRNVTFQIAVANNLSVNQKREERHDL